MAFFLATIETESGPSTALVVEDRVIDLRRLSPGTPGDMISLISQWSQASPALESLAGQAQALGAPLGSVRLLAPILNPGAIYCAGSNYRDHAAEMARRAGRPEPKDPHELGLRSWHFLKTMHSLSGPGATVRLHPRSEKVDWEAELAVVIGKKAFQVREEDALGYVFGYSIANDLSARDLSRREGLPEASSFRHDWVLHKNWDGSCPFGPWIALARDVGDPHDLEISLDVNGERKQHSNSGRMIFDIKEQIADLSRNFTLWPGDVILTGTPAGVGAGRGEFLKAGDAIRVSIAKIGILETKIGA